MWLCPETRILADTPGLDDYVYDGKGHRIILPEGISGEEGLPLILVGPGKTLHLRDVKIVHAASLSACLQLAAGMLPLIPPRDLPPQFSLALLFSCPHSSAARL